MKIVVGNSVEGDNFFGRRAELATLRGLVETDHVLLLAPRRVGKSSLLRAVPHRSPDGRVAVYADVQGCQDEASFLCTVLAAVHATAAGRAARPGWIARRRAHRKSRLTSVSAGGVGAAFETVEVAWQVDADRAFDRLLALDHRWLILIDELPNVVVALSERDPSGERVRAFLSWFRRLRQRPDAAAKLRFVLCGSIGLDHVARRHRIPAAPSPPRCRPRSATPSPTSQPAPRRWPSCSRSCPTTATSSTTATACAFAPASSDATG